jgi:hypothetical protein
MTLYELDEFIFLCKQAKFKTLDEVNNYCKENCINWKQLFNELDGLLFPTGDYDYDI